MTCIYKNNTIKTTVSLKPLELSKDIDGILQGKLKDLYEGKCIKEGYVRKNSISIKKRSIFGILENGPTDGTVNYDIIYSAEICNPNENDIIEIKITKSTKVGLIGESLDNDNILQVFLPIEYHQDDETLEKINEISDKIVNREENITAKIEVICKKFNYNDKKIVIIGRLVEN